MTYGIRHTYDGDMSAAHPHHEFRGVSMPHGYSVQSSVSQSSGRPDEDNGSGYQAPIMNRFDSEGDGDYRLATNGKDADSQTGPQGPDPASPAGYDLQGIGGQNIHDTMPDNPPTQGRVTRREVPLNTHDGAAERETDYGHPGEQGFRYMNKENA